MPAYANHTLNNFNYFIQDGSVLPVLLEDFDVSLLHKQKMSTHTTVNAIMSRIEPLTTPAIKPESSDSVGVLRCKMSLAELAKARSS